MRSLRWDLGLLPTEAEIFISYKIVIELDGSQHGEPENREADTIRDKSLGEYGIRVLRYTNKQIKQNFRGVCLDILKNLEIEEKDVEW